jgi:hypothetical protein
MQTALAVEYKPRITLPYLVHVLIMSLNLQGPSTGVPPGTNYAGVNFINNL